MNDNILDLKEIEKRRRVAGLSRKQIYEAAGVHHSTWSRLMNGDNSPNLTTLKKLTDAVERLTEAAEVAE